MTRAQHTLSVLLLITSVYLACYLGAIPLPTTIKEHIIPIFPLWAVVSFGAYLLFKLGFGVLTFNDVPEAHKELIGQIETARKELRVLGVDID